MTIPALLLDISIAPTSVSLVLPGLRHISGIKEWGPYQKAKAVVALKESGLSSQEVSQSLGLTTRATNQLWRSYLALEQMKKDDEYGDYVHPRMYSYFEEIMKQPDVREWLGWDDNQGRFTKESHAKELYSWIVGEKPDDEEGGRTEAKLVEAKSIRRLGVIINDERSLSIFRAPGGTLDAAYVKYESLHQLEQQDWKSSIISTEATFAIPNS